MGSHTRFTYFFVTQQKLYEGTGTSFSACLGSHCMLQEPRTRADHSQGARLFARGQSLKLDRLSGNFPFYSSGCYSIAPDRMPSTLGTKLPTDKFPHRRIRVKGILGLHNAYFPFLFVFPVSHPANESPNLFSKVTSCSSWKGPGKVSLSFLCLSLAGLHSLLGHLPHSLLVAPGHSLANS